MSAEKAWMWMLSKQRRVLTFANKIALEGLQTQLAVQMQAHMAGEASIESRLKTLEDENRQLRVQVAEHAATQETIRGLEAR